MAWIAVAAPWAITVVLGYVLGSVPCAVLVGRAFGFDPRVTGDRNPGFWNVKSRLGWRPALPVFAGDLTKGALGALTGWIAVQNVWGAYAGVAAAMAGHAWPIFARFRGGKAILAFAGGIAAIAPMTFLLSIAVLAVVAAATRSFAWGARAGIVAIPVIQLFTGTALEVAATGGLMTFIGLRFLLDRALARVTPSAPASGRPTDAVSEPDQHQRVNQRRDEQPKPGP